jgi:hypothetical protein
LAAPHFIHFAKTFQLINIPFVTDTGGKWPASLQIPCEVKVA